MIKVNLKLVVFLSLFFFVFPAFSNENGRERQRPDFGGRNDMLDRGGFSRRRQDLKGGASSGSGSERRTAAAGLPVDTESHVHGDDSYNPSTGWHTVCESSEVVKYRGTRKAVSDEKLEVSCVTAENCVNGTTTVEICFNQEINPRSFSSSNLKINGKTADNDVKFKFSRKGDSVKIQIPVQEEKFSLSLGDVEAFDGEKIPEIKLNDILIN